MACYKDLLIRKFEFSFSLTVSFPSQLKLTKLGQLDLSYNKLVNFPDICNEHFTNLSEVNLQNNEITEIPDEIQLLIGLKHLNMSVNRIVSLPKALASISKLKGKFCRINIWVFCFN